MDFGNGRQQASRAFWDSINRNKMGNADQMWDGMMDVASARAQALGLAPIRPTAAQEAASDAARLKRARDYWRNPGPKLGPFPTGDQVVQRERIPGGPISTLPADQAMERLKGPPRLSPGVGASPSNDADYEALLTRARNGYYLDGRERQALVGRFGAQLGSLLDSPAEGAAMRPREFKQRADRLKMMAALGIGTNGGAPGAMPPVAGAAPGGVPAMPVSTAGAPGAMPVAGSSGGAMPTAGMPSAAAPVGGSPMSGGVPLPGYQGMQQATPLDTMLSGKSYLQNRAQINRAARDYRRSGFNPQMAALLAQEQQAGNRGFMAQSELMNRGMANEANAQAMGYNQGLGDLNIKDRTRQDMVDAAGREASFRDREYTDRKAMIDKLMGGDGAANPQAGMNDAMRYAAMDWMSPGLGKAMAEADGNRRGEPDAKSQLQAAAMAASQGDPLKFRQLMQAMDQTSGGAAAGGGSLQSIGLPTQDESGNPVVDEKYVRGLLDRNPQATPQQIMDEAVRSGIDPALLRQFAAGQMPSPAMQAMEASQFGTPMYPLLGMRKLGDLFSQATQSPESRRLQDASNKRYQNFLRQVLGDQGTDQGPVQSWWKSGSKAPPSFTLPPEYAPLMY